MRVTDTDREETLPARRTQVASSRTWRFMMLTGGTSGLPVIRSRQQRSMPGHTGARQPAQTGQRAGLCPAQESLFLTIFRRVGDGHDAGTQGAMTPNDREA
jgi:hypothetical protein